VTPFGSFRRLLRCTFWKSGRVHELGKAIRMTSLHATGLQHDSCGGNYRFTSLHPDCLEISQSSGRFRLFRIRLCAQPVLQHAISRWCDGRHSRILSGCYYGSDSIPADILFRIECCVAGEPAGFEKIDCCSNRGRIVSPLGGRSQRV